MYKKAFSLVEIGVVLLVITAVFFTVIPLSVSNLKQAKFIAEWKDYMSQVTYSWEILTEYKKENQLNEKESVYKLLEYLDAEKIDTESFVVKNYSYKMMNGHFYEKLKTNTFDEVYEDSVQRLVGVKYSDGKCSENDVCATVWVDLNGAKSPNIVGNDIFVYEIYSNSVEPYGKGRNFSTLRNDCSKKGSGMQCSKFYLIGGDLK